MSLDFPASGQALWALYNKGGPRPEYILPVLFFESSGFQTNIQNGHGAPNYGLNQISKSWLDNHHIDLDTYLNWPASTQISRVVTPYLLGVISEIGRPLESGIQVYQATYLPATLSPTLAKQAQVGYAPNLDDVMVRASDPQPARGYYNNNIVFDGNPKKGIPRKGYITPRDLGNAISDAVSNPAVQSAIAKTYALRPGETPADPVLGTASRELVASAGFNLFPPRNRDGSTNWVATSAIVGVGALVWAWHEGYLDTWVRRAKRIILLDTSRWS